MAFFLAFISPIWNGFARAFAWLLRRAAVTVEVENRYGTDRVEPTAWRDGEDFMVWAPFRLRVLNHSASERKVRISRIVCNLQHGWRYERSSFSDYPETVLGEAIPGGDFSPWIDCLWTGTGRHKRRTIPKRIRVIVDIVGARKLHKTVALRRYEASGERTIRPTSALTDGELKVLWSGSHRVHHYEVRQDADDQSLSRVFIFYNDGSVTQFDPADVQAVEAFLAEWIYWWNPVPVMVKGKSGNLLWIVTGHTPEFKRMLDTALVFTGCKKLTGS